MVKKGELRPVYSRPVGYTPMKLQLSTLQKRNAANLKPVLLKAYQIDKGNETVFLHAANFKAVKDALRKNKGVKITLSPGEIMATKESDMEGTGMFDFLKKGWDWIKNNWSSIKPVASAVLDVGAPMLGPEAVAARQVLKAATGTGMKKKIIKKPSASGGLYLSRGQGLYI